MDTYQRNVVALVPRLLALTLLRSCYPAPMNLTDELRLGTFQNEPTRTL